MKYIYIILFALISLNLLAQEGMKFEKGNWEQAREKAIATDKLIFVDFYTQWCGPCLNMAKNTFVLYSVGTFYNSNFVNMKIDAEYGEGIDLAKKYGIRSYPTYLFIDPVTEEIVHRSSGNQTIESFLFTGASALDPKKVSTYFDAQLVAGATDGEFLLNYANYKGSIFDRTTATKYADMLIKKEGYSLVNPDVWNLFNNYISSKNSDIFKELVNNIDKYRAIYGYDVDKKIYSLFSYVADIQELIDMPEFNGKKIALLKIKADKAFKAKDYQAASNYTDSLMILASNGVFTKEICNTFIFFGRSNLYGQHPDLWHDKCLEIMKFVAYNNPERDSMLIHYEYARQLELKLKKLSKEDTPKYGVNKYSLRSKELKQKPKRK